ncbi:MAG: hypothetical protein AB9919_03915 [Geobacteraceae bacterium]|jgi:hypothetical protein
MSDEGKPQRLCSEIQLFDLCSDEKCAKKNGRYCTDEELLNKFEAISNEEDFSSDQYLEDEDEAEDDGDDSQYSDSESDYDDDEDDLDDDI